MKESEVGPSERYDLAILPHVAFGILKNDTNYLKYIYEG